MNYIKVDDNKIINEKHIKWVKKIDECLRICTKSDGCVKRQTHALCKVNNEESYLKLNAHFVEGTKVFSKAYDL
jgi:hypothetical protein